MSYNKYFNKTLISNQSGNILTLDNSNLILNFKKNLNFNILNTQENLSIDQTDKSQLNIKKIIDNNDSSIQFFESASFSNNFQIDTTNFYTTNNNLFISSSDSNQSLNFLTNVFFDSNVKSKNIYGLLKYVDEQRQIPWLSGSSDETVFVDLTASGFRINKANANNESLTYITCDPDDGFSSYNKNDIVKNSEIPNSWNFVNNDGIYTNTLYLKLGSTLQSKKKYMTGDEHTFIIDIHKSLLPGWGFESNHPLNQMPCYSSLRNQIMLDSSSKKLSQSIALDLSGLLENNELSPGYVVNIYFKKLEEYPSSLPCIYHTENNVLNVDSNTPWENFTFDSRYSNFSKSELELNSSIKNEFKKTYVHNALRSYTTNGATTVSDRIDLFPYFPYYNTFINNTNNNLALPISIVTETGTEDTTYRRYFHYTRNAGRYYTNKFIVNYFKPFFFINLGRGNIILNNLESNDLKKIKENQFCINQKPYNLNESSMNSLKNVFLKQDINVNYFIDKINQATFASVDSHLDLNDENPANNQPLISPPVRPFHWYIDPLSHMQDANISSHINTNNFYQGKNLTTKFKISNYEYFKNHQILKYFQFVITASVSNKRLESNKLRIWNHFFVVLKAKSILNLPFTNLKINSNYNNLNDWHYMNNWKIKDVDTKNIIDLSENNSTLEDFADANPTVDIYGARPTPLSPSQPRNLDYEETKTLNGVVQDFGKIEVNSIEKNDYDIIIDKTNRIFERKLSSNYISLKYLGFNSSNSTHEWVYI